MQLKLLKNGGACSVIGQASCVPAKNAAENEISPQKAGRLTTLHVSNEAENRAATTLE